MRLEPESSSAPSRTKTPDHRARAKTPSTPDTIRSRAKTPEGMRPRSAWTELGDKEENVEPKRAASANPSSRLKKPKVFCEDDFKKFLARQDHHKAAHARHLVIPNGLIAGLSPTPLLPIMNGNGFVIQGSIYVEADWRSKPQQGKHPTWAKILPKGITSTTPVEPSWETFLQRQKESLDRKKKRAASDPPPVIMPQKSQDEINSFLKRKQDEVSERAANLEKMQLQFMAEVCLATAHAKKLHSRENVQPPDFLDRHYVAMVRGDHRDKVVHKAMAKWKTDYPYQAGQSKVLDNEKVISPAQAVQIYDRLKVAPSVATREPYTREPKPVEANFRSSGNPYRGGKADLLRAKLGEKACLESLPSSIE